MSTQTISKVLCDWCGKEQTKREVWITISGMTRPRYHKYSLSHWPFCRDYERAIHLDFCSNECISKFALDGRFDA